jgi:hypothetical protein
VQPIVGPAETILTWKRCSDGALLVHGNHVAAHVLAAAAVYRRHLAVRSWVVIRPSKIAPTREDLSVAHNHGRSEQASGAVTS